MECVRGGTPKIGRRDTTENLGLDRSGARLSNPEHPVVRVHLARERLVLSQLATSGTSDDRDNADRGGDRDIGYRVSASLLGHPLVLLALAAAFLGLRRPRRERRFLLTATLVPLLFAYVPAAAGLLGAVVLPWMVYRVLWMIPFGPLLATAAATIARGRPAALGAVVAVATAIAAAPAIESFDSRQRPERAARAWGTAEALREVAQIPLSPSSRERIEAEMGDVRDRMGEIAFDTAHAWGRGQSLEEAIAAAFEPAPIEAEP